MDTFFKASFVDPSRAVDPSKWRFFVFIDLGLGIVAKGTCVEDVARDIVRSVWLIDLSNNSPPPPPLPPLNPLSTKENRTISKRKLTNGIEKFFRLRGGGGGREKE